MTGCHSFPCCLVFHRIFRLDSSPWRPRCSHHRRCTAILSSLARHKFVGVSLSLSFLATHRFTGFSQSVLSTITQIPGLCLVHDESTSTRSWCAARLDGSFVTVKSSRLSGHRARVILLQSIIIALYFGVFFAPGAARARSVCTYRCSRITESTVFKRTHHKDQRQLQLFQRLALHDCTASCVCARSRHICSIFFCLCETSTCGLCKAADVQRSGPGPGRRAHEAAQRQTQFLDHVLCLRNTITSRRHLPQ